MAQGARQTAETLNPSLASAIKLAQEVTSTRLRVAMPGKIVKYDAATALAEVQPLLQYRLEGDDENLPPHTLPIIPRVPVIHPAGKFGGVLIPLAAGDPVVLLCSDRALDTWKTGNLNLSEPNVGRQHDLTDCWAIPGGFPQGRGPVPRKSGALEVWLKPGTPIAITNGTDDLVELIVQLVEEIVLGSIKGNLGIPTIAGGKIPEIYLKLQTFKA